MLRDTLLILHLIGRALGLGTSLAFLRTGAMTAGMNDEEQKNFMTRFQRLSLNADIGLALLIVSGLGLLAITGFGVMMAVGGPWFHAKLTLVLVLILLVGFKHMTQAKMRRAPSASLMGRMMMLGHGMRWTTLAIVVCAVFAFH
jgi:uncharacterized membrane protein SirB2